MSGVTRREFLGSALLVHDPIRYFRKLLESVERTIDPVRWEFSTVATMTTASHTSKTAPALIHFQGVDTTTAGGDPYDHTSGLGTLSVTEMANILWDFDDASSGNYATNSRSRNRAVGPNAAHVYATAGTYTPLAKILGDDDSITVYSQEITVSAFSGTTYHFDATLGDDGDDGTIGSPKASFLHGMTLAADNVQLLFKKGEAFTTNTTSSIAAGIQNFHIGAYGTGADPTLTLTTASGSSVFRFVDDTAEREITISGLNIIGPGTGAGNSFAFKADATHTVKDLLIYDCEVSLFGTNCLLIENGSPDISTAWNQSEEQYLIGIVDCNFHDANDKVAALMATKLVLQGTTFADSVTTHVVRVWFGYASVVESCSFSGVANGQICLKFHGQANGVGSPECRYNVFSHNYAAASGVWTIVLGPQDGTKDERGRHNFFLGNTLASETATEDNRLVIQWPFTYAFNNIFLGNGGLAAGFAGIYVATSNQAVSDVHCINNTFYRSEDGTFGLVGIHFAASVSNCFAYNNGAYFPGAAPSGPKTVVRDDSTNLTASNNDLATVDPFVNAAGGDYTIDTMSGWYDAGAEFLVRRDFDTNLRDGEPTATRFDIGCYGESSAADTVEGGGPAASAGSERKRLINAYATYSGLGL